MNGVSKYLVPHEGRNEISYMVNYRDNNICERQS